MILVAVVVIGIMWFVAIVMVAAVARSESTNLSSTSSFKASGCSVRWPSVWAALAIDSTVGCTRT